MREMKDSGIEWIGEIPKDKKLRRTKYDLSFIKGKIPTNINNEKMGTPYIGASNLDCNEEYDVFTTDCDLPLCEYNDTLILWDGARAGLVGTGHKGFISSTIMKVSPINDKIDKEFFYWYCKGFEWYFYMKVNGTTIPHMNRDYIYDIGLIEFNKEEQHRIADYLDKKCSKIDEIISKQQTVIEKLKEYKLSIITEAVTKGLNPDITMKDSGVEWIGEIPEHWKVVKIKIGVTKVGSGKTPSGGAEIYSDTGVLFLRSQNIYDTGIVLDNPTYITSEIDEEMKNTRVLPNDVLLNITGGSIGRCAIFPKELNNANVNQHVSIIRTKKDIFTSEYMHYYWISDLGQTAIKLYQTGGNREGMSADAIKNAPIALLPIQEQKQITDYLDSKCEKIDFTINKKQKLIDKLTEYKKSLIYEVVTGKKEV